MLPYGTAKSAKSIKLSWKKVSGAKSYVIYGNSCGKKNKYKKIASVKKTSFTAKKLKKNTYYKYIIVAVNGDQTLAVSKTIHVSTKKTSNNTGITVKGASKDSVMVEAGKSVDLTAKLKKKGKVKIHRKVAWESDDISVATVKNGRITGVKAGTCYVYAYAQNGLSKKIKVTVS